MPGAINIPFGDVLTDAGTMKDVAALQAVFDAAGVDLRQRIITSCGSGVTACILALALARLGVWDVPVYDGAWSEWASTPGARIATGNV